MNNERPTLKEWVAENPRKSINDYYKIYGTEFSDTSIKEKTESTRSNINVEFHKHSTENNTTLNSSQIICMIFSIIITLAYFLPWIELNILGQNISSVSGFELPKMMQGFELAKNMLNSGKMDNPPNLFYVLHLIPICGLVILISVISKTNVFRFLGELFIIMIMSWFIYKLTALQTDSILNIAGMGLFFSVICSMYFLFDLLKIITK